MLCYDDCNNVISASLKISFCHFKPVDGQNFADYKQFHNDQKLCLPYLLQYFITFEPVQGCSRSFKIT